MTDTDADPVPEVEPPTSQQRLQAYEKTREDLLKRSLSNSESFDRAVLSLAAAIIGFTTVFLKDIKSATPGATHGSLEIGIWLLALAVVTTIVSIFTSQHALNQQIERAGKVLLDCDETARELPTSAKITSGLN